jgi:hypothetical protein
MRAEPRTSVSIHHFAVILRHRARIYPIYAISEQEGQEAGISHVKCDKYVAEVVAGPVETVRNDIAQVFFEQASS